LPPKLKKVQSQSLSSSGTAKHSRLCQRHGSRLTKSLQQNDILDGGNQIEIADRITAPPPCQMKADNILDDVATKSWLEIEQQESGGNLEGLSAGIRRNLGGLSAKP
jgi:hypothetical protein